MSELYRTTQNPHETRTLKSWWDYLLLTMNKEHERVIRCLKHNINTHLDSNDKESIFEGEDDDGILVGFKISNIMAMARLYKMINYVGRGYNWETIWWTVEPGLANTLVFKIYPFLYSPGINEKKIN